MRPGKITRTQDGYTVEFQRMFKHPIEKVWDALTNPDILKIWFTKVEMDFRVGGKMKIYFADASNSVSSGEIVTIQPPTLFEFTWEGELATWELTRRSKASCMLRLTYSRLPPEYAAKAPAGFHIILDQLDTVLNGRTEQYLLGTTTDDPVQKKMEAMYIDIVKAAYPDWHAFL